MKCARILAISVLVMLLGLPLPDRSWGQASPTPLETVTRAVNAMGGADALRRLERVTLKGQAQHWEPDQSYVAGGEARFAGTSTLTVTRDFSGGAARVDWERNLVYPGSRVYRYSEVIAGGIGYVQGVDATARPARALKTNPPGHSMSGQRLAAAQRELQRTSPRFLLNMLASPQQLSALPEQHVDARFPAVQFRNGGQTFTVMFDPETRLPARIRVLDFDNIHGDWPSDVVLSDWRAEGGIKVARQIA